MKFIETLINGLSMGSTYAMIALGYTMVYGIAKMLNFAHGDIIMVSGYVIFLTMSATHNPILGLLAAINANIGLCVADSVRKITYPLTMIISPCAKLSILAIP